MEGEQCRSECSVGGAWDGEQCRGECSAGGVWEGEQCRSECSVGGAWEGEQKVQALALVSYLGYKISNYMRIWKIKTTSYVRVKLHEILIYFSSFILIIVVYLYYRQQKFKGRFNHFKNRFALICCIFIASHKL